MVDGVQEIGQLRQDEQPKRPGVFENIMNLAPVVKVKNWLEWDSQHAAVKSELPAIKEVPKAYETLEPHELRAVKTPKMVMLGNEDLYCVPTRYYPIDKMPGNDSVREFKLHPCVVVVQSDGSVTRLMEKGTVGRNPENVVVVPGVSVSRRQVELIPEYRGFSIQNLAPSNETRVQDISKMAIETPKPLEKGKVTAFSLSKDLQVNLKMGDREITLQYDNSSVPFVYIDKQKIYFPVDENEVGKIGVGRDPENEIVLDDPKISRDHLKILRVGTGEDTTFFLLDQSTNGVNISCERKKIIVTPDVQPSIIEQALARWTNSLDKMGNPRLQRKEELVRNHNLGIIAFDGLRIISPNNRQQEVLAMNIPAIAEKVSDIIGGYPKSSPIDMVLAPGSRYVPRAVADGRGDYVLLDMDGNTEGVFAHELVHAELGKKYGPSALPLASEGAALIIGRMVCPDDKKANESHKHYGYNDVVSLLAEDRSVGLSPTALNEHAGRKLEEDIYEYAYFFGGYFGEFFISKYGLENFLTFYKNTCGDVKDENTGRTLAQRGRMLGGVQQRELTAAALQKTAKDANIPGLTPEGFSREFSVYLKQQVSSDAGVLTQANVLLKKMFM